MIKKLECLTCGGRIDGATLTCLSCGVMYMLDNDFKLKVIQSNLKWSTVYGCIATPCYILDTLGPEQTSEITLSELAKSMSPKLLSFAEFQTHFNPKEMTYNTVSRIRVAEPVVNRFGYASVEMPKINFFK